MGRVQKTRFHRNQQECITVNLKSIACNNLWFEATALTKLSACGELQRPRRTTETQSLEVRETGFPQQKTERNTSTDSPGESCNVKIALDRKSGWTKALPDGRLEVFIEEQLRDITKESIGTRIDDIRRIAGTNVV